MAFISGLENFVEQDTPLAERTWFKLGGAAEYFAQPPSQDALMSLVTRCREEELPMRILGGGSNVLVRDDGVKGVIASLEADAFLKIEVEGNRVRAAGGAPLAHVISAAVGAGLSGLESLVGIPGSIGGALHTNAAGHAGDIGQWTSRAVVMTRTGEILERAKEDLDFSYRQSSLDELVILEADFELEPTDPKALTKRMQQQWIVKKASQPLAHQAAGCLFKNVQGTSVALLIEQAGLKMATAGGAAMSERDANFVVVRDGGTTKDVIELIEMIQNSVRDRLGVELELQLEIW
ncbi:MAG: UDP-N-acetylmuramate dehydrogenase [Pirellulales bacterium]|nr:UDP-N-acetylmuramate dehydrogenase [Pirellulales bacterium]